MLVVFTEQQHAFIAHEFNDLIVCIKHALTSEVLDVRRESSRVVDGTIDF